MGEMVRTLVLSGYYGFGNSGDEAVLHAIVQALREEALDAGIALRIIVLSGNPSQTESMHGVEAVHRMRPLAVAQAIRRADALISGGGSLLQDVTSAKSMWYYLAVIRLAMFLRKPVFIYAQGIGPIRDTRRFGPPIRSLFSRCKYISVRDRNSKELLSAFGVPAEGIDVVPDPVMGLRLSAVSEPTSKGDLRLGVSVRFWREDQCDLDGIADVLTKVLEARRDVRVTLFPFHLPYDLEASEAVAAKCAARSAHIANRIEVHGGVEHPEMMMREIASCDVLVGMRLHSLIYAAACGVPPVAVSYDPKIDRFMDWMEEKPAGSVSSLDPVTLAEAVLQKLELKKNGWKHQKNGLIVKMQQNSRKPAKQIVSELRI